jgi:site-specific DNA recombinase
MTTSTKTRPNTRRSTKKKRAALYARISHDDGAGLGVERQRADMRKLAKREGWTVEEYVDNDQSASRYAKKRRKDFDRMLRAVDAGIVDVIVCADLSRYTREPRLVEDLIDITEGGHVELWSLTGGHYDVTTAEGKSRLRSEAQFAAQYSDFISDKVKRKKADLIAHGDAAGGTRAFGYKSSDFEKTGIRTGTVIEPAEAKAYRKAVDDVLAGATLISIARRWNAAGLFTPRTRSPWGVPSIRATLTNPKHAGLLAVSRYERVKGADGRITMRRSRRREVIGAGNWPAIITPAQHDRLVALLDSPDRRRRNPARRSLLTGFVRCQCGSTMRRDPRYYRCHALPDEPNSCGRVIIAADALDQEITAVVLGELKKPRIAKALRTTKRSPKPDTEDPAAVLMELDQLAESVGRGELSLREHGIMRKGIEARLDRARAAQAVGDDVSVLAPFAEGNADKRWAALGDDLDRKRAVMRALFDMVTITAAKGRGYALDVNRIGKIAWKV